MVVEDAVSAQFVADIPAFAKTNVRAVAAHPSHGAVFRSISAADHPNGCFLGGRQGDCSGVWREGTPCGVATGALRLAVCKGELEQGAAGHGLVKRS